MKLPTGRFGFLSPARERRIARDSAEIALSWLTTRWCSSSSIRSSLWLSSSLIEVSGTPVHLETTSSISCLPTATRRAPAFRSSFSRMTWWLSRACDSCSRYSQAFSRLRSVTATSSSSTATRMLRLISPISALVSASRSLARAPASSMRSIALSGRNRSEM